VSFAAGYTALFIFDFLKSYSYFRRNPVMT